MSYEAQDNAIRSRFVTQWAAGANTPIKYENVEFTPPADGSAWVALYIADAGAQRASFGDPGNNLTRHVGLITVMINTPLNRGDKLALEYADDVRAIFVDWQHAATRIRVIEAPFVRRIGVSGRWYQVNVIVPFQRDAFE